jgi:RNA polymerase sigma-70 factor (ECF subfamily)
VEECVRRYKGLVWSLARRYAGQDAEDAVQEIFIDLWKSAGRFQESVASEPAFVAMIARRRLIDRRRRAERQPALDSLDAENGPEPQADSGSIEWGAEAALAARAIAELQDKERQVLLLSVAQGMSHAEISEHTRLPLGTVKTYARRSLQRVRERLLQGRGKLREVSA